MPVTANKEEKKSEPKNDDRLRARVLEKVTVSNVARLDIRPVGKDRYRVNVWAETGLKTEDCFVVDKIIAQSFFFIDK